MFGQNFSHNTIKKYVVLFGSLFNNIIIQRDNAEGDIIQTFKVPLGYGPKEKYLARAEGNPDLERPIAMQLPRMSFEITNMEYDALRKVASINKVVATDPTDPNKKRYQYSPVPYNFQFTLYIMVKNAEDGTRIIEQILPFFTPDLTSTLNLNPELGGKYDIPIIIDQVTTTDSYEGPFEERRAIIWSITFTLKGYLFGPTRTSNIIKQTEINIKLVPTSMSINDANSSISTAAEIITIPGLTAAGEPTSNAALSIDKDLIVSTDNYGFITDFIENI
jgi:T4-like virus Myoviridae tail sheath stabiliser